MTIPTIIALVFIGGFFLFVIGCVLYRKFMAKITVTLDKDSYALGDTVTGNIIITPHRNINVDNIEAIIECNRIQEGERASEHGRVQVYFEETKQLSGHTMLQAKAERRYPFSFTLPTDIPTHDNAVKLDLDRLPGSHLLQKQLDKSAEYLLYNKRWHIVARMKCNLHELVASKIIPVQGFTLEEQIDRANDITL